VNNFASCNPFLASKSTQASSTYGASKINKDPMHMKGALAVDDLMVEELGSDSIQDENSF